MEVNNNFLGNVIEKFLKKYSVKPSHLAREANNIDRQKIHAYRKGIYVPENMETVRLIAKAFIDINPDSRDLAEELIEAYKKRKQYGNSISYADSEEQSFLFSENKIKKAFLLDLEFNSNALPINAMSQSRSKDELARYTRLEMALKKKMDYDQSWSLIEEYKKCNLRFFLYSHCRLILKSKIEELPDLHWKVYGGVSGEKDNFTKRFIEYNAVCRDNSQIYGVDYLKDVAKICRKIKVKKIHHLNKYILNYLDSKAQLRAIQNKSISIDKEEFDKVIRTLGTPLPFLQSAIDKPEVFLKSNVKPQQLLEITANLLSSGLGKLRTMQHKDSLEGLMLLKIHDLINQSIKYPKFH